MPARRTSSRREFLQGRSAADAVADLVDGADPHDSADRQLPGHHATAGYLVQFTRRAMACDFEVILPAGHQGAVADQAVAALELVAQLEDQMTIYRDDSELARINSTAAAGPTPVEPQLFELLLRAERLRHQTDGAFDITTGALNRLWRDARRQGDLPDEHAIRAAVAAPRKLRLDPPDQTIAFDDSQTQLDLGAIGKGYAIDRVAARLDHAQVLDYLVHGAGSSVYARGTPSPAPADARGWSVGVRHPLFPERRLVELRLRDRALSTSGSLSQSFRHRGRRYGHIVDPRTGWPADTGIYSATVIAESAADADALSTAFLVLGRDAALDFCHNDDRFAALLVGPGTATGSIAVDQVGIEPDAITWHHAAN